MFDQPKLNNVISYLALSVALYIGKDYITNPKTAWLGAIMTGLAIVFFAGCVVTAIHFVIYNNKAWEVRVINAKSDTELVKAINALSRLDEGQLYALMHTSDLKTLLSGIERRTIPFEGFNVDLMWFMGFIRDDEWLAPSRYMDAEEREWAEAFIRAWVLKGYAEKGAGPYPARWKNKPAALKMVGVDLAEWAETA